MLVSSIMPRRDSKIVAIEPRMPAAASFFLCLVSAASCSGVFCFSTSVAVPSFRPRIFSVRLRLGGVAGSLGTTVVVGAGAAGLASGAGAAAGTGAGVGAAVGAGVAVGAGEAIMFCGEIGEGEVDGSFAGEGEKEAGDASEDE